MGWASKCGKTSLINVVENVGYSEDLDPIIGFHMREVIKGNVTFKIWDASGQSRFRSSWERFVHVGVLLYVDAADLDNLFISKNELHKLCKTLLNDGRTWTLSKEALTDEMGLQLFTDREVCCFMISCKNNANIDEVFDWLLKHSKSNKLFSRVKQEFAPAAGLFQSGLYILDFA
ncbi:hypothetical protein HID58_042513 [Brassica napus]|uniref:Uncharacterized protein n=1 Tax=Brassica napus TaxID=3708 RepID=A0ABQ8BFJ8_BRANA|nr:hypothetical protein HID58_042513 [Brassica napus]